MAPRARSSPGVEARLLKLAAFLHEQRDPVSRVAIYEAFPDDYRGSDAAREKKFTRDKEALLSLGIALRFVEEEGGQGAYVLDLTSSFLPALSFSPEEAAVVWAAGQAALVNYDHPLADDLETALRKLVVGAKGLPPKAASLETDRAAEDPGRTQKLLAIVTDALTSRRRVRMRYRNAAGVEADRLLDVYGYAWRRGEWIVVGYCHLRNAIRIFYLRRFIQVKLQPARPHGPDYRIPASFDIRQWSRQEPWDYLAHEARPAAVSFRGSLAEIAGKLLPGAGWSRGADGSRVARLEVRNLKGLVRQVLAWGPEAELVEPEEGRHLAREILDQLATRLNGGEAS
ncbi:MAG TPA: WYL domain-containing protein [Anaeromyxobacteraceae bacterium]|nr:WYL domain-containing protein [Anaeromyxobacteraceae bacterium]